MRFVRCRGGSTEVQATQLRSVRRFTANPTSPNPSRSAVEGSGMVAIGERLDQLGKENPRR